MPLSLKRMLQCLQSIVAIVAMLLQSLLVVLMSQFSIHISPQVKNGMVTIDLPIDHVMTLSTKQGQRKGSYVSPSSQPFPIPYKDDFESDYYFEKLWSAFNPFLIVIKGMMIIRKPITLLISLECMKLHHLNILVLEKSQ